MIAAILGLVLIVGIVGALVADWVTHPDAVVEPSSVATRHDSRR
jgi:hypothetical protein